MSVVQSGYELLVSSLTTAGLQVALYAWDRPPQGDYGVVSLSEGNDLIADGIHVERGTEGYLDYFTRDASEAVRNTIEAVLNDGYAWYLNSVQYENDTHYIHYEWRWSYHG